MKRKLGLLALAAACSCMGADVSAHHPFSEVYALEQGLTIEGDIAALVVRLPHSYLHVLVSDGRQETHQWAVEWATRDDGRGQDGPMRVLNVGDHIVATGYPGRDPSAHRILVRVIKRPADGWQWMGLGF